MRRYIACWFITATMAIVCTATGQQKTVVMTSGQYRDHVQAVWTAQVLGAMMGWPFEHKVASTEWIDRLNDKVDHAPVDDDWYYEMVAVRAFEKYGTDMTVEQLGKQWVENSAGSWGSSEQARLLMARGIPPPACGHPRYNKLWHSIGPQFSAELYGALAPGLPNEAGRMARMYSHINGYAEGADGGVFIAGMVSLAFTEKDPATIVKKAARLIHPSSPYRKCLDMVIRMASSGSTAAAVFEAVEKNWHIEYPATNNAVANGGIVAACVWYGKSDFLKTVNLAFGAADFTDADCNAAGAGAVVGAMHGMKALPAKLVAQLGDEIKGSILGKVPLTPAVNESLSALAQRTAAIGEQVLRKKNIQISSEKITLSEEPVITQPAELFSLSDLTTYWNPAWKLERAGFGGAGGGMQGIRGITYLEDSVLATYPRDEVKAVLLSRTTTISDQKEFSFDAGADSMRVWQCVVFLNNRKVVDRLIEGSGKGREWQHVSIDLAPFRDQQLVIRVYQRVLITGRASGNAYWKNFEII